MARLPKIGVDYFPHYVGSRDGKTLFILKSKFGNDGYAFWYQLLEILGAQKDLSYACDKTPNWLYLTATTGVDEEKATEMLDMLAALEAIDEDLWKEDKVIWCQDFADQLDPIYRKRRQQTPSKPKLKREIITTKAEEVTPEGHKEHGECADSPLEDNTTPTEKKEKEKSQPQEKDKSPEREEEGATYSYVAAPLRDTFLKWLTYKKEKGKPYKTEVSIKTCYEQLYDYSSGDAKKAQQIINTSIANNYEGFFPLKETGGGKMTDKVSDYLTNAGTARTGQNISTI